MKIDLSAMPTFGVAGNFTGHLEQAGEAKDFINVKTAEETAPKAIFPTYIPQGNMGECGKETTVVPGFLRVFPFDDTRIIYPKNEDKLQIEPECAIICKADWSSEGKLLSLTPEYFGASNDCSIRKEGAKKISEKKNWGKASKGFSANPIQIDSFSSEGIINNYRIASFLVRGNQAYDYGEDSPIRDYSYVYKKLLDWCVEKLNNQQNQGPAENIHSYLTEDLKNLPEKIMLSIGATRYTEFGQTNFLQNQDKSVVILYPEDKYSHAQIKERLLNCQENWEEDISVLIQTVTTEN